MTTNEVQQILLRLAAFEATMQSELKAIAADSLRGESVHADHEGRLRTLETAKAEDSGAKKQYSPGGWVGAIALVIVTAVVTHYAGR